MPKFPQVFRLAFVLSALIGSVLAQDTSLVDPVFPNVALEPPQMQTLGFSIAFRERDLGWVSGRVFDNSDIHGEAQPESFKAIAGVKVILRSADKAFSSFVREQFTNEKGIYDFPGLSKGEYTVEVDQASVPGTYRIADLNATSVNVKALDRSYINLALTPQRTITGIVFIDKDGDGRYRDGKDEPVAGAHITIDGNLTLSGPKGVYVLRGLSAGRLGILVNSPTSTESTHVVIDLAAGPVTNRVVNVPVSR